MPARDRQRGDYRVALRDAIHGKAEKLLVSGPKVPRTGGLIIARTKAREEVDQLIIEDPFHQEKIADYEVVEFQALKFHPALSSLVQAKE